MGKRESTTFEAAWLIADRIAADAASPHAEAAEVARDAIGDLLDSLAAGSSLSAVPACDGTPDPVPALPHDARPSWMRAAWEHGDGDPLPA